MTSKERRTQGLMKLKKMRVWMIIGYALIVVTALGVVSVYSAFKYQAALKSQASSLTSSLNVQLQLNLESYLSRIESVATMAFGVENAYTYDETTTKLEEYDKINLEKAISDELFSLCLMENFVDYGIVYRDNTKLGKVSNGTLQLFGNDLFTDLQAMIIRESTRDGWYTGYKNDYDRIYYVKQIHENALMVLSFYTTELQYVFDNPETMHDMAIRMTDKNYKMIYSSEKNELGQPLPEDLMENVQANNAGAILDEEYLTTVNTTDMNWHIVCSIPTDMILAEAMESRQSVRVLTFIAALLAVLAGSLFSFMLSDPISVIAVNMDD